MDNLTSYEVTECPSTVYYIPNFISEGEEKRLLDEVYRSPKTKWTTLSNRRLQNWGGIPQAKGMIQEQLPKWLQECCTKVQSTGAFGNILPNHVLVNEYTSGQGIMPHLDGPLYFPTVSTISLGSHTVLNFYESSLEEDGDYSRQGTTPKFKILLEQRSLLLLQSDMYKSYMHGIEEVKSDAIERSSISNLKHLGDHTLRTSIESSELIVQERGLRVSLTIRHVPNSKKLKLQFGKHYR